MEPVKKRQKTSHTKITITAISKQTNDGVQAVYLCSACDMEFETVSAATAHTAEHRKNKKRNVAGDNVQPQNATASPYMDTALEDSNESHSLPTEVDEAASLEDFVSRNLMSESVVDSSMEARTTVSVSMECMPCVQRTSDINNKLEASKENSQIGGCSSKILQNQNAFDIEALPKLTVNSQAGSEKQTLLVCVPMEPTLLVMHVPAVQDLTEVSPKSCQQNNNKTREEILIQEDSELATKLPDLTIINGWMERADEKLDQTDRIGQSETVIQKPVHAVPEDQEQNTNMDINDPGQAVIKEHRDKKIHQQDHRHSVLIETGCEQLPQVQDHGHIRRTETHTLTCDKMTNEGHEKQKEGNVSQEQGHEIYTYSSEGTLNLCRQDEKHSSKKAVCKYCSVSFSRLNCFANHLVLYHNPFFKEKSAVWCPICARTTASDCYYSTTKLHLAVRHDINEMKCMRCDMMFKTCSSLFSHIENCKTDMHDLTRKDWLCKHCKVFHVLRWSGDRKGNIRELLNSILKDKPKEDLTAKMRESSTIIALNAAKKAAQPVYRCLQCDVKFKQFSCLMCHIANEHAEAKLFSFGYISSRSKCDDTSCGTKHTLSRQDVDCCRTILADAGLCERELKDGGVVKIRNSDADLQCSATIPPPSECPEQNQADGQTDIKSRRLSCLKKCFEFDRSLGFTSSGRTVKELSSFNLLTASTKEEIGKDMVHRIEYTDHGYECAICLEQYQEYGCCKNHVLTSHHPYFLYTMGSEMFTCPVCSISYHNIYRFEQHLEFHGIHRYCCKKCNLFFNNHSIYQKHLKHSTPETIINKSYSCSSCKTVHYCVVTEGEKEKLNLQIDPKRRKDLKILSKGSRPFYNTVFFKNMPKNRQNDICGRIAFDDEKYVCLQCKKTFEDFKCCASHVSIQHVNLRMTCLICKQHFITRSLLSSHLKTDHQIESFLYCYCCLESFDSEKEVEKHSRTCTDAKSNTALENRVCKKCCQLHADIGVRILDVHSCNKCKDGFAEIACMKNHYYREHFPSQINLISNYNRLQCPGGKQFLNLDSTYKHIHEIHSTESDDVQGEALPKINLPVPNERFESDFQVLLKKSKSQTGIKKCRNSVGKFKPCEHCSEYHVVHSQEIAVGNKSSKRICPTCDASFKTIKCLKNHLIVEHDHKLYVYECVLCGRCFPNVKLLELHQGRHNPNSKVNDTNDSGHGSSDQAMKSGRQGDSSVENRIACTFSIPYDEGDIHDENKARKQPSRRDEDDAAKPSCTAISKLTCADCSTVHLNKYNKAEKVISTGDIFDAVDIVPTKCTERVPKSFIVENNVCPVCGIECDCITDVYKHVLDDHVTINFTQGEISRTADEAYSCSYCPEKFRFSMDAQLHCRVQHGEKPLVIIRNKEKDELIKIVVVMCPICYVVRGGARTSTIAEHLKTHFKNLALFVCDTCGKALSSKELLKQHIDGVHLKAQHKCTECGKCFKYYPNLYCHMKTHKVKTEACPVCGMKFTLPSHVRAHVKRKH